jgi:hypothetical protein
MLALVWMVYKIRHIKDNTKVGAESKIFVAWWMFAGLTQYTLYLIIEIDICNN